jgi:DNA-binding beta-propeller fold protein YncE
VVEPITTSSTPTLTRVISDEGHEVVDVTSISSRLFVLRSPSQQKIQVYDTETFKPQGALEVKDLSNATSFSGLTSCVTNSCVYVSDSRKDTVFKVVLSGNNQVFSWKVGRQPRGMSINTASNLLVVCYEVNEIHEYITSGSLMRKICLTSKNVELRPYHAIQLTKDDFLVSYWHQSNRVDDVAQIDTVTQINCSRQLNTSSMFHVVYQFIKTTSIFL